MSVYTKIMKLYICYTTNGNDLHACAKAYRALRDAGYNPEIEKVKGSRLLPQFMATKGRKKVALISGNSQVPTLVLDNGNIIDHSGTIVEWANSHLKQP